jgi:hypothetical protein
MNKFDRPYRYLPTHDPKKVLELFNLVENLDTSELLHYSLSNQIPFDVIYEDNGNSLIHIVVKMDKRKTNEISKLNVIKFLFQNGANPDTPNKMNQTPLHLACQYQLPIIVKYLLDINVNPNYTDNLGLYPFHYLFFGEIKPVVNTKVLDFVQPPKEGKVDFIDNETIIKIKIELYELIKDDESLKIIKASIGDLIKFTKPLEDKYGKVMELYNTLKDPSKVKSRDILDAIKLYNNQIYQKIKEKFNNFKDLSELNIHKGSKLESWKPNGIGDEDYFLIKNYDFKKEIKKNILLLIDGIKLGYANYNEQLDTNSDDDNNLHPLAIDEASSIIDFDNNFYLGGARKIVIREIYTGNSDNANYTGLKNNNIDYILHVLDKYNSDIIIDNLFKYLIDKINKNLKDDKPHEDFYKNFIKDINELYISNLNTLYDNKKIAMEVFKNSGKKYNNHSGKLQADLLEFLNIKDTSVVIEDSYTKKKLFLLTGLENNVKLNTLFQKIDNDDKIEDQIKEIIKVIFELFKINLEDGTIENLNETEFYKKQMNDPADPTKTTYGIDIITTDITTATAAAAAAGAAAGPAPAGTDLNYYKNTFNTEYTDFQINKIDKATADAALLASFSAPGAPAGAAPAGAAHTEKFNKFNKKHIYILNFSIYIIRSYIEISKKICTLSIMSELEHYYKDNSFLKKWDEIFKKKNKNIGLCIFGMYCDLESSLLSNDNLDLCTVPFRILALAVGLENKNLVQGVINMYKPHIIHHEIKNSFNKDSILKLFLFFLHDNLDYDKFKNIIAFKNDEILKEDFDKKYLPKNQEIQTKNFLNLLGEFINDKKIKDKYKNYAEYKTKYNNFRDINIIQELFISIYNNLINKPLIQNMNDLLYLLNKIKKPDDFIIIQNISIFSHFSDKESLNNSYKDQPSGFGIDIDVKKSGHHFIISHLMGLNYLGDIKETDVNILDFNIENVINFNKPLKIFNAREVSLPDLFIFNNAYNLDKENMSFRKFKNPNSISYNNGIINKINDLKNDINRNLKKINTELDKLKSGKIKDYDKIFKEYYINIIKNSKIVDNLLDINKGDKNNFNLLRENLNYINSLFYIFYFLKNKKLNDDIDKKYKLSHFNQYLFNDNNDYQFNKLVKPDEYIYTNIMKGGDPLYNFSNIYINEENIEINFNEKLPNSLYNNLDAFYKYSLIDLIYKILDSENKNKTELEKTKLKKIIEKLKKEYPNKYIKNYELVVYNILSKLIEEIYKQELDVYIYNYVRKENEDKLLVPNFKTKDMAIDLEKTEIKEKLTSVINIYPIIRKSEENNKFILYQNDFSNTNRFKISNEFFIDEKIIKILIEYNSNIFNPNIEGITPIYSLLKLNNNKVINKLFDLGKMYNINIKDYIGPQSIEFIKKECENNLNKFLNNYDVSKDEIRYIFNNINGYLYDDIKLLITSNESFGNNVLSYLEESFSICSYITLQFLGKYLTSYNLEYDESNSKEIFELVKITLTDMKHIYIFNNIEGLSIPTDHKIFIAKQLLDEKKEEIKSYNKEKIKIDEKTALPKHLSVKNSIEKTTKYADINTNIDRLNKEINKLEGFIRGNPNKKNTSIDYEIEETVKKYEDYLKPNNYMIINYIWQKIFETKLEKNHDLILINLINRQSICLSDTKNLNIINDGLKHISNLCETYFEKDKYTDDNYLLKFINELLIYLTKIIICNGIEQMMRKILFSYLSNSSIEEIFEKIDNKINFILDTPNYDLNKNTLLKILFEDISIRLVQSSVNIFENKSKQNLYSNETVRDILTEYFDHLKIYEIYLSESILNVFISNVVTYFDSFISRTILLWLVNIENIFKFFINNYRSTDILLSLSEDEINPEIALANLIMKIKENYDKIIDIIKNKKNLSDFIWYIFPTDKISKFEPEPKTIVNSKTSIKLFENDNWINIHKEINKLTNDDINKLFYIIDIDRIILFITIFKTNSYNKDGFNWNNYIARLKIVFSL